MAEGAKEIIRTGVRDLVEEAGGMPMLTSKSCDGTPIRVTNRTSATMPSGRLVKSQGSAGLEILVCNQFVRVNVPGRGWVTRVMLGEPVPLEHGKIVPAIVSASFRDWKTLRQLGHAGCCVEHYVWDRASITSLVRWVRQYHFDQEHALLPDRVSPELGRLTEFVLVTPCALHDAQNSFRWALLA